MKTAEKSARVTPLTKSKSHHRWAWLAGATAAAAATPHSLATTSQITLVNNTLDSITGNHLSFVITTGGHVFGTLRSHSARSVRVSANFDLVGGPVVGLTAFTLSTAHRFFAGIRHGGASSGSINHTAAPKQKAFALFPVTFIMDPNVDGGQANTLGQIEVEAFNQSATDQTAALLAVFFPSSGNTRPTLTVDPTSGVITGSFTNVGSSNNGVFTPAAPEPSGLGLLALGAGGILARRQRRKSA